MFERCSEIGIGKHAIEISESAQSEIMKQYDALAAQGLRVLTLCGKRLPVSERETITSMKRDDLEREMAFLGLAGIYDPPRPESAAAVQDCHEASVIPRMLTGDHLATATAIAKLVGIIDADYPKTQVMVR